MGLRVERPGRRWVGVGVVQGLSFRIPASQVGCGRPQSQCQAGRGKGSSLLPTPCPRAQLYWSRIGGDKGGDRGQGQSPASPSPGAGPSGGPGILAEEESGMMGLAHPLSPCCLASTRPNCTVTLGPFLLTRSQWWGLTVSGGLTPAVSPTA